MVDCIFNIFAEIAGFFINFGVDNVIDNYVNQQVSDFFVKDDCLYTEF